MISKGFYDVSFPLDVGFGASGGPQRRTDIVALVSGHEERNARWADSRRSYDAGLGIRSLTDLEQIISFFEQCRGRLYGFRFRDPWDHSSTSTDRAPTAQDQQLAIGDGSTTKFQLIKQYGSGNLAYQREITKPVEGSVQVALDGVAALDVSIDHQTGLVSFPTAPAADVKISAGFLFDVPVRFDTDRLDISLNAFQAGDVPSIPLLEIRS
jgi:uncharacterized protein (TIGR02217 family)